MKVMLVLGTRPQIIKSAPIIQALQESRIGLQLIHTGQHYDFAMSKIFFDELDLPDPLFNLEAGSGTHAWQTGQMMIRLEPVMKKLMPDVVLVPGDTNSALAAALVAAKLHIPVGHVEAGLRSNDLSMPEEINRKLTDHCSQFLFAPTKNSGNNLLHEGIAQDSIFQSGDTMYDAFLQHHERARKSMILNELGLKPGAYAVLTLHRPENVDNSNRLRAIIAAVLQLRENRIVFPAHPRVLKQLEHAGMTKILSTSSHVSIVKPVGYHEMLKLIESSCLFLTDSGGLQKETFFLHVPCLTLRDNTEWIETVQLGANMLVGADTDRIVERARAVMSDSSLKEKLEKLPNPFGNGKASANIVRILSDSVSRVSRIHQKQASPATPIDSQSDN